MNSYRTLSNSCAVNALEAYRDTREPDVEASAHTVGIGHAVDLPDLDKLASELEALYQNTTSAAEYEAQASQIMNESLHLPALIAGDAGFWRWLSLAAARGAFTTIIAARFGKGMHTEPVNFGIGSKSNIREGLLARLWWRGHALHDADAADPYCWAKRGDMDTWRSHLSRTEYGACPNAAKALLLYQFPEENQIGKGILPIKKLRELAKLMRVMHATYAFETMSLEQCSEVVKRLVDSLD